MEEYEDEDFLHDAYPIQDDGLAPPKEEKGTFYKQSSLPGRTLMKPFEAKPSESHTHPIGLWSPVPRRNSAPKVHFTHPPETIQSAPKVGGPAGLPINMPLPPISTASELKDN